MSIVLGLFIGSILMTHSEVPPSLPGSGFEVIFNFSSNIQRALLWGWPLLSDTTVSQVPT